MRKLASVRTIKSLSPIPDADLIETATVDGWHVVVKKGEFAVGDKVVYCEIDSWIPHDIAPFLSKGQEPRIYNDVLGAKLRTVTLRGQISQGLILPLSILPKDEEVGTDVSEILNIQKWEAEIPAELNGQVKGLLPSWIKQTEQERCQNLFDEYKVLYPELEFEESLKLHGTSCTFFVANNAKYDPKEPDEGDFTFGHCQRNFETRFTPDKITTPWSLALEGIKDDLLEFAFNTGRSIALQGELMGPGINKNWEKLKKPEFFLFNIWDIDQQRMLTRNERLDVIATFKTKIQIAPIVGIIKVFEKFDNVDDLLKYVEGPSINNPIREGSVFKSEQLVNGQTISFKAVSNQFLKKGGE